MNQDVKILQENKDDLFIEWPIDDTVSYYKIVGLNNLFVYEEIIKVNDHFCNLKREQLEMYLAIKIDYILKDGNYKKEIILGSSNLLYLSKKNYSDIQLLFLPSYKGISISFQSDAIYDKYLLYEKKEDSMELIYELEDFQVTSTIFEEGKDYYVEGLIKKDSTYELVAKSEVTPCIFYKKKKGEKNLSIVMPVYNGEMFIQRTIDSILFSNFTDMELIIIDDGCKDNSPKILDWYQKKYKNIINVVHQENGGLCAARNVGIELAKGKYIAFIDHDDYVHPYMYKKLYDSAIANDLDVAIAKTYIRENINEHRICLETAGRYLSSNDVIYSFDRMFIEKTNCSYENIYFCAVWNKIAKAEFVKAHRFPKSNHYEDTAFTMTLYTYLNKFGLVKDAYYVWDKRFQKTVGTFTNTYFSKKQTLNMKREYYNAIMYPFLHGNPDRMDNIALYCVDEIYRHLDKAKPFASNDVLGLYKLLIIKIHSKNNLLENTSIVHNKKLFDFVKTIIK